MMACKDRSLTIQKTDAICSFMSAVTNQMYDLLQIRCTITHLICVQKRRTVSQVMHVIRVLALECGPLASAPLF